MVICFVLTILYRVSSRTVLTTNEYVPRRQIKGNVKLISRPLLSCQNVSLTDNHSLPVSTLIDRTIFPTLYLIWGISNHVAPSLPVNRIFLRDPDCWFLPVKFVFTR